MKKSVLVVMVVVLAGTLAISAASAAEWEAIGPEPLVRAVPQEGQQQTCSIPRGDANEKYGYESHKPDQNAKISVQLPAPGLKGTPEPDIKLKDGKLVGTFPVVNGKVIFRKKVTFTKEAWEFFKKLRGKKK